MAKIPELPSLKLQCQNNHPKLFNSFFQLTKTQKTFPTTLVYLLLDCIPKVIIQWVAVWGIGRPLILGNEPTSKCLLQILLGDVPGVG